MKVILDNNLNGYYASISPVYPSPITYGTKVHVNLLSAIFCNIFTMMPIDAANEMFDMFNESARANLPIESIINNVIRFKDQYGLIFKTMPDIYSIMTEIMCQRFNSEEIINLDRLISKDEIYTFKDPTGLLGENNTPFSMNLYDKFLHTLVAVGSNEAYVLQEIEKY